jgi:Lamin Tail Domain
MKIAAALLAAVATAALTLLPFTPALASGHRIQINEIYYNSPGRDTGSNSSLNAEWVRLYNTSSSKISLTNWTLRDSAGHIFKFGTYTLGSHSYVKIHTGHGTPTQTDRYWNRNWYIWNNTGDTATLRDSSGGTVDSCHYNGTSAGYVFC